MSPFAVFPLAHTCLVARFVRCPDWVLSWSRTQHGPEPAHLGSSPSSTLASSGPLGHSLFFHEGEPLYLSLITIGE